MDHFFITVQDMPWRFFVAILICFILSGVIYYSFRGEAFLFMTSYVDVAAIAILFFVLLAVFVKGTSLLNPQGLAWHEQIQMRWSSFFPDPGALVDAEGNHRFSSYDSFYEWVNDYDEAG